MEPFKKLHSYVLAVVISDLTVEFCKKFISRKSRTVDQMTQVGRSGKQNIAEGASGQSLESYIKLLGVAEASFKELAADYEDHLRQHNLITLSQNDPKLRRVRQYRAAWVATNKPNTPNLPSDQEQAANAMLSLCARETYLLGRQIASLKQKFVKEGGLREGLYRQRVLYRQRNPRTDWGKK